VARLVTLLVTAQLAVPLAVKPVVLADLVASKVAIAVEVAVADSEVAKDSVDHARLSATLAVGTDTCPVIALRVPNATTAAT